MDKGYSYLMFIFVIIDTGSSANYKTDKLNLFQNGITYILYLIKSF